MEQNVDLKIGKCDLFSMQFLRDSSIESERLIEKQKNQDTNLMSFFMNFGIAQLDTQTQATNQKV